MTLAGATAIRFTSESQFHVIRGQVYVDSPDPRTHISVITDWGELIDIGTQYEVTVDEDGLRLVMREGKVKLLIDDDIHYAAVDEGMGDVFAVDTARPLLKSTIAATEEHLQWAIDGVPHLDLEGISAYQLVSWASRITGKTVSYSSP